jgi:hypothetical protein
MCPANKRPERAYQAEPLDWVFLLQVLPPGVIYHNTGTQLSPRLSRSDFQREFLRSFYTHRREEREKFLLSLSQLAFLREIVLEGPFSALYPATKPLPLRCKSVGLGRRSVHGKLPRRLAAQELYLCHRRIAEFELAQRARRGESGLITHRGVA